LRLEISCESDKKKMNLIFNYDKKIFLTEKNEALVSSRKQETRYWKNFVSQQRRIRARRNEQTSLLIGCPSGVDRIRLCAQFPASASGS
jgi:hypothetical protein